MTSQGDVCSQSVLVYFLFQLPPLLPLPRDQQMQRISFCHQSSHGTEKSGITFLGYQASYSPQQDAALPGETEKISRLLPLKQCTLKLPGVNGCAQGHDRPRQRRAQ
ncbi:hypothetical protein D3C78_1046120 [compost metagenome]